MVQETIIFFEFITFLFQDKLNMRQQKKKGKESPFSFSNQRTLSMNSGDDVKTTTFVCRPRGKPARFGWEVITISERSDFSSLR